MVRTLRFLDAELSAEPMAFDCGHIVVYSGLGRLISMEK